MKREYLDFIDHFIYDFLDSNAEIMPKRLGKIIAIYYTDARIRKKYSHFIGVEMGRGTYANLGLNVVPNLHDICVHIGENVSIAPNVTFLGGTDPNNGRELKQFSHIVQKNIYYRDIYVKDEAWIGAGCIIFPGITIGRCSVIGAGSIVMQDVEDYAVYVGTPARKVRSLKES